MHAAIAEGRLRAVNKDFRFHFQISDFRSDFTFLTYAFLLKLVYIDGDPGSGGFILVVLFIMYLQYSCN